MCQCLAPTFLTYELREGRDVPHRFEVEHKEKNTERVGFTDLVADIL
jgi:hypothetical protein